MESELSPPAYSEQIAGLTFGMVAICPEMTLRQVNPAAESLLGQSAKRLIGRNLIQVMRFEDKRVVEMLEAGHSQLIARNLILRMSDKRLTVDMTISPLQSHIGWRIITLSDSRQAERLSDEEKPVALRGPAVLAHEIKNPLAAIKGAAQLLARKIGDNERSLTAMIVSEVDRIAQLIDRMQRLGREKAEPVSPVNLHESVHRACDSVKAASGNSFTLRESFDPSLPQVLANDGALVQVLINILANARDACADEEKPLVTIQTRFVSGLVMNVFRLGRPVKLPIEIQVSDNGPGVDPALRDHIFEPFVSSKKNGQGLGLALVHKLVRDMDGTISHDRDEQNGQTHFRIHLPMVK